MEAPPATTPFSHPVDEYDECWSRHDVTQNASGDFQSVRTIGTKSFGAPYCLQGHEGTWQLLPETRGSPPLPPLNWHQRHRRGANATPALEGTGWSLMVLSQQGRLFDSRLEYNMSSAGTLRSSSVVCRHVCQSGHRKKACDAVTRQQRHTRSARPSAWKHRSFSKWRLTERPACLSPPPPPHIWTQAGCYTLALCCWVFAEISTCVEIRLLMVHFLHVSDCVLTVANLTKLGGNVALRSLSENGSGIQNGSKSETAWNHSFIPSGVQWLSLAFYCVPSQKSKYYVVKVPLMKWVNMRYRHLLFKWSSGHVLALQCALNAADMWVDCQDTLLYS